MAPTTDDGRDDDWATRHARTAADDDAGSPVVDAGRSPASDDWRARHGHVRTVGVE